MKINKNINHIIYFVTAFVVFSIFSLRDNYFISDALNYVEHAKLEFDLSNPNIYSYIAYWALIGWLTIWFNPESIPGVLSLLISGLIIYSSLKLKNNDRWIFLFFCILSPVIFNLTQVALRNGIALGIILVAIAYSRTSLLLIAPMVHPGTIPIVFILFLLKYSTSYKKSIGAILFLGFSLFFLAQYFESSLDSRGYATEGGSNLAGATTYISVIILSCIYFLSLKNNPYRLFMPAMVLIWIFISFRYEFGGRLFLQSLIICLYLTLNFSDNRKFKLFYILGFFVFSFYGAIIWHPLSEFYDGWAGHWLSLIQNNSSSV